MAYKNMSYAGAKNEARASHPNSFNIKTMQKEDFPVPLTKSCHRKEKWEDRIIPGTSNKWDSNGTKRTRIVQIYASGREGQSKNKKKANQNQ